MWRIWPLTIAYSRSFAYDILRIIMTLRKWIHLAKGVKIHEKFWHFWHVVCEEEVTFLCCSVSVKSTLASILNRFCSSSGVSNRWTWTILLCYYDEVKYSQNFREWKVFSKRNSHAVINSHLIRTRQSRGKLGGSLYPLPFHCVYILEY